MVNVLLVRTAGTNCDQETAAAFEYFGANVDHIHIQHLDSHKNWVNQYHILVFPGGFTYGDDIASGRILANEVRNHRLSLEKFLKQGKLILGICNGFQVLVKAGLLPGFSQDEKTKHHQSVTLTHNDSGKFEARWCPLRVEADGIWLNDLQGLLFLPVAHAEGRFITIDESIVNQMIEQHQIAFRYCAANGGGVEYPDNPNGSMDNIAGITDPSGQILGMMPHPERHFFSTHHPSWSRQNHKELLGDGAKIFENAIKYVEQRFKVQVS